MNTGMKNWVALAGLAFLSACASSPAENTAGLKTGTVSVTDGNPVWESSPRSLGAASGAQLWVRASEAINMIVAVPGESGVNLHYRNSHNEGQSFAHDHQINKVAGEVSAHGENNPQLRMGPGIGIYALWEGGGQMKFARSMNFGKSFLPPVKVNDDEGKGFHSFFDMETAPDGAIYVAWIDGRDKATEPPGQASIYLARSDDQGATFGANVKVSGNICPCCRTAMAIDDQGTLYLAWRHVFSGDERTIVVATSSDAGKNWTRPVRVSKKGWKINGCAHSGPAMKWVGGRLIVTWYTAAEGKPDLLMAQSTDGGKTFSSPAAIQGPVFDPNHPHMAEVNGEAWIIFQGRNPRQNDGWGPPAPWLVRVGGDGAVTPPQSLPSSGNSISYPQLFTGNGGRVYAVWTEHTKEGPQAVLTRGRLASSVH